MVFRFIYAATLRISDEREDHPHTASSFNNLGLVYFDQGDFTAAAERFEQAARIAKRRLASDHPLVQQFEENLAEARSAQ